jgi:hypothetical protein
MRERSAPSSSPKCFGQTHCSSPPVFCFRVSARVVRLDKRTERVRLVVTQQPEDRCGSPQIGLDELGLGPLARLLELFDNPVAEFLIPANDKHRRSCLSEANACCCSDSLRAACDGDGFAGEVDALVELKCLTAHVGGCSVAIREREKMGDLGIVEGDVGNREAVREVCRVC